MKKMREWKGKYQSVIDDITAKQNEVDDLSDELEEWKRSADDMRQQYEDAFHELTPTTIQKVWVKNVDKTGMYILFTCLSSKSKLYHANTNHIPSFLYTQVAIWNGRLGLIS